MSGNSALLGKAVRAAAWGYGGTAIKLVMQLGVQILLARILGPAEYGLFAIGVIVVAFALYFGDVASSALIPREEISPEQLRFAFTWQLLVSGLVTGIIFLLAEPIAGFVNEPKAAFILQALSFVCVLNAVGGVGLAILRRRLDYKMIQVAQVVGYFVGYVLVALPWALWWEPSVSALVAAWMIQVFVTSIIFMMVAPHSVLPKFVCEDGKQLLLFGWHSLLSNLGTWAIGNIDRVVVARTFPAAQVGLYTTSSNLLATPLSQIYATFQSVIFSATARLEQGSNRAGEVFVGLVLMATLVVGMAYGFTFSTADALVDFLYGEKWSGASPFIQAFSIVLFFNALSGIVSPLLWACGAIKQDASIQITMAVLLVMSTILASYYSALAIAWAVAACSAIRAVYLVNTGIKHFGVGDIGFKFEMMRLLAFLISFIFSLTLIKNKIETSGVANYFAMVVLVLISFLLFIFILKHSKLIGPNFCGCIALVVEKMPNKISRILK